MNASHKLNKLGNRLRRLNKKVKEGGVGQSVLSGRIKELNDILGIKK